MLAVAYCRVSTKGQVGEDKYGLDAQRADIEKYCKEHDIKITGWYVDEGISGAKDETERPELRRILNGDITNPPVQAVIVAKSDRLSRVAEQYFWFKYAFIRMGIELISVSEDFGAAGTFAPVYEAIVATFAQMEREMINSRMGGGRRIKASKGGYAGGKAPYGYDSAHGSGILTVNDEEAAIVRRIFDMRSKRMTMKEISDKLNDEGCKTKSGGVFRTSTIQYILSNRKMYEGYYRYGKSDAWVKGTHTAILEGVVEE